MTSRASRGVIRLIPDACTVCMICVQECPSWCITIDSHHEEVSEEGARRPRTVSVLDRFAIDFGLCMYCGICVDVCPFDALEWVASHDYAAQARSALEHGTERLASHGSPLPSGSAGAPSAGRSGSAS